ncbi:MAG: hypothetical protein RR357_06055 [Clostridia bacterium]
MAKQLNKKEKIQISLLALSVVITIFGIMFLLTSAELVPIFKGFYKINNMLGRYIIVILTMSVGIMLFSNVAMTIENKKMRNGLTLGITIFASVLTLPLVYVFIAIFPAHSGKIGAIGEIMMINRIVEGFIAWFGNGNFVYVVYTVMLIVSIIFLAVPLVTGVLGIKGKALKVGKQSSGKFGIGIIELPVITKVNARESK